MRTRAQSVRVSTRGTGHRRLVPAAMLVLLCGLTVPAAHAAKLHIIQAVDEKAEQVGRDLKVSELIMPLTRCIPDDILKIWPVDPRNMSEPTILETLRKVPVEADDAVVFLYVGHGAFDNALGTVLTPSATTGQVLSATRMVQEVRALGARLSVVILDCCNRERAPKPTRVLIPAPEQVQPEFSPLFDELFFRSTGAILVESSSPGEYALVKAFRDADPESNPPPGPIFINALGKTFGENRAQRQSWSQIMGRTQTRVDQYFQLMKGQNDGIPLDDGTVVQQDRQTVQLRFFQ